MNEPLVKDVLGQLLAHPSLCNTLTWTQVWHFIQFCHRLWPEILGPSAYTPQILPLEICGFLSSVLGLDHNLVQLCWTAFSDMVLSLDPGPNHSQDDDMFHMHRNEHGVGAC